MKQDKELENFIRIKQLEKQLATVTRALADAQEQLDGARALLETYKQRNNVSAHIWTGEDDERG